MAAGGVEGGIDGVVVICLAFFIGIVVVVFGVVGELEAFDGGGALVADVADDVGDGVGLVPEVAVGGVGDGEAGAGFGVGERGGGGGGGEEAGLHFGRDFFVVGGGGGGLAAVRVCCFIDAGKAVRACC